MVDRGLDDIHADAEAHVAVFIGKGNLDQGHVHLQLPLAEELRYLGKMRRRVIAEAAVDDVAGAVADKKRIMPEILLELLLRVGGDTQGPDVDYPGPVNPVRLRFHMIDEGLDEELRFSAGGADKDTGAAMDQAEDIVQRRRISPGTAPGSAVEVAVYPDVSWNECLILDSETASCQVLNVPGYCRKRSLPARDAGIGLLHALQLDG